MTVTADAFDGLPLFRGVLRVYLKMCYVQAAKQGILESGISLDPPFRKRQGGATRKIGSNSVVKSASDRLSSYLSNTYYLIIAPEEYGPEVTGVLDTARQYEKAPPYWDYSSVGYLSWPQIAAFAEEHDLRGFQGVLEHNQGQIY